MIDVQTEDEAAKEQEEFALDAKKEKRKAEIKEIIELASPADGLHDAYGNLRVKVSDARSSDANDGLSVQTDDPVLNKTPAPTYSFDRKKTSLILNVKGVSEITVCEDHTRITLKSGANICDYGTKISAKGGSEITDDFVRIMMEITMAKGWKNPQISGPDEYVLKAAKFALASGKFTSVRAKNPVQQVLIEQAKKEFLIASKANKTSTGLVKSSDRKTADLIDDRSRLVSSARKLGPPYAKDMPATGSTGGVGGWKNQQQAPAPVVAHRKFGA